MLISPIITFPWNNSKLLLNFAKILQEVQSRRGIFKQFGLGLGLGLFLR